MSIVRISMQHIAISPQRGALAESLDLPLTASLFLAIGARSCASDDV